MSDPVILDLNAHLAQQEADEDLREMMWCPKDCGRLSENSYASYDEDGPTWHSVPCNKCQEERAEKGLVWYAGEWRKARTEGEEG